jgi:hypothetical protein
MKRRSFLKIAIAAAVAPLSLIKEVTAPAATMTKTMELEGALADYMGFPAHGGYVYCPYIPITTVQVVRDGKWKSETKSWGKITGWTTL